MAAKRPTGELPKRLSKAAAQFKMRTGAEGKKFELTPSAAAAAVGKARDKASSKAVKNTSKTTAKKAAAKLVGPAAVAALKKQVSPSGMKKSEAKVKKATDKKYPGLYKKSK